MKNYIKKNIKVEENYINQMIKNKKPTTMRELAICRSFCNSWASKER